MRALPVILSMRTASSSRVMPAAGTHIVTRPNRLLMDSNTDARNASSVVLPRYGNATSRPAAVLTSAATLSIASPMSTSATARTPRFAMASATARPMPLAAPVITATLSANSMKAPREVWVHCNILALPRSDVTDAGTRCPVGASARAADTLAPVRRAFDRPPHASACCGTVFGQPALRQRVAFRRRLDRAQRTPSPKADDFPLNPADMRGFCDCGVGAGRIPAGCCSAEPRSMGGQRDLQPTREPPSWNSSFRSY